MNVQRKQGIHLRYYLAVPFLEAVLGCKKEITTKHLKELITVYIPPGMTSDNTIRIFGKGMPGIEGGPPGDLFVVLFVQPHRYFQRQNYLIHIELPVPEELALLGGQVDVPTIYGIEHIVLPKVSPAGHVFRLRNKGIRYTRQQEYENRRADQIVRLSVYQPGRVPEKTRALLQSLEETIKEIRAMESADGTNSDLGTFPPT